MIGDLPVGLQLVTARNNEQLLLDLSEDLEEIFAFNNSPMLKRWSGVTDNLRAAQ